MANPKKHPIDLLDFCMEEVTIECSNCKYGTDIRANIKEAIEDFFLNMGGGLHISIAIVLIVPKRNLKPYKL